METMDFKPFGAGKPKKKTLSNFLYEKNVFGRGRDITHIDMLKKRNYHISGTENTNTFFNLYANAVNWMLNPKNEWSAWGYTILEKVQELSPMLVDIDIKCKSKKTKALYTEKHVLQLTKIFQKVLKKNIQTKLEKRDLDCFVLEKEPYLKDGYCKNGFHLHFPYIWLKKQERRRINFLVEKAIAGTRVSHLKPDNSVVTGNWLMYGSCKSYDTGVYKVSYIIRDQKKVFNPFNTTELIFLLSVIPKGWLGEEQKFQELKPWVDDGPKPKTEKTQFFEKTTFKQLKHYISFLRNTHSEDFLSWRAVGCALFNETDGSEKGRSLWHKFSQGCDEKYSYYGCNEFWNKLEPGNGGASVGTLKYYLKQSGVTDYEPKIRYLSNARPDGESYDTEDEEEYNSGSGCESEPEMLTEREEYEERVFGGR